jgi:hypothetical protein
MRPPLVYIHKGFSWYLPLAFYNGRAKYGGQVVLIGNRLARGLASAFGITPHNIDALVHGAHQLAESYRHHSSLGVDFELFCIQRWFMLRDYMRAKGLDACCYIDSDVLLTEDIGSLQDKSKAWDLVFTGYSAHVTFVNRLSALESLCDFILEAYNDPIWEERFIGWHHRCVADSGSSGVSDMTFFHWFYQSGLANVGTFGEICGESPVDMTLEDTCGWQKDAAGFKHLSWVGNTPYATKMSGQRIQLVTLHHQGRAKSLLATNSRLLGTGGWLLESFGKCLDLCCRAARKIRLR